MLMLSGRLGKLVKLADLSLNTFLYSGLPDSIELNLEDFLHFRHMNYSLKPYC